MIKKEDIRMMLKLGSTTRPWHTWSFDQACQAIAHAGYEEVSIYSNAGKIPLTSESTPTEIAETVAITKKYEIVPTMLLGSPRLDLSLDDAVADFIKLIDATSASGCPWVMNGGTENEALFDKYFEIMRQTAPYAEKKGVQILLKPHGGLGLTGRDLANAVEKVNNSAFRICYDPGNIIYYTKGKVRPEPDVDDVAEFVTFCIIKDCIIKEDGNPDVWILPGDGLVDFPVVLGKLVKAGFSGPLHVECLGGSELDDVNERAWKTREWLEKILEKL
jgi:sugar phosphate isomerase/epimerase